MIAKVRRTDRGYVVKDCFDDSLLSGYFKTELEAQLYKDRITEKEKRINFPKNETRGRKRD